jgi:hypothetical protein
MKSGHSVEYFRHVRLNIDYLHDYQNDVVAATAMSKLSLRRRTKGGAAKRKSWQENQVL